MAGKEIAIYNGNSIDQWNLYGLDNVGAVKSNGDKQFYLKDHLGSIRAILDSTNTVVQAFDYDCWGYPLEYRSYEPVNQRYKFTSKELDKESSIDGNGYDYFGARYYDSRIANWLSVDPLFEKYYSWSSYNYVLRKPLTLVDPKGKQVEITIRTYIPQESSTNPLFHVMHDNRHADYNSSSYRTEQKFIVEPNKNISENAVSNYHSDIGTTEANPLLVPIETKNKGKGNLPVPTFTRETETTVNVSVTGEAWESIMPFFHIDYYANFYISENQDGSYTVISQGTEDGFPSYEIWAKNIKSGGDPVLIYNRENENVFPEILKLSDEKGNINFYNANVIK